MLESYTGDIFRPPIIRLTAHLIRIRFQGNGGTGSGYRAIIRYINQNDTEETVNTHCGGLVEYYGGAITMMNMTNSSSLAYDCIWLVKPPNSYLHLKTHLLVRIDTFENMGNEIKYYNKTKMNLILITISFFRECIKHCYSRRINIKFNDAKTI